MKSFSMYIRLLAVAALTFGVMQAASANIWMDETFEDGPFTQGDGTGTVSSAELDVFSTDPLASTITASPLTTTGSVSNAKAFEGSNSYQLDPGDVLSVGDTYQSSTNGNYVIFQFAVNVDPIPAAGEVARWRYNCDTDNTAAPSPDHSFYVKLESNGTTVDIIAGEDVANGSPVEHTIGTLSATTEWQDITVVVVNGTPTEPYAPSSLDPITIDLPEGVHFYNTAAATINFASANGPSKIGLGWGFSVTSGVLFVDAIYWEGGMDGDAGNSLINLRPFAPSSVGEWSLY